MGEKQWFLGLEFLQINTELIPHVHCHVFISGRYLLVKFLRFVLRASLFASQTITHRKFNIVHNRRSITIWMNVMVIAQHEKRFFISQELPMSLTIYITLHTKSICSVTSYPYICFSCYFCWSAIRSTTSFVNTLLKWFILTVCLHSISCSSFTLFNRLSKFFIHLHPYQWIFYVIYLMNCNKNTFRFLSLSVFTDLTHFIAPSKPHHLDSHSTHLLQGLIEILTKKPNHTALSFPT